MLSVLGGPLFRVLFSVIGPIVLVLVLAIVIERIVQHSFSGAISSIFRSLSLELTTDTGRINLIAMIVLLFAFMFGQIHKELAEALSVVRPVTREAQASISSLHLAIFFVFSVLVVARLEGNSGKKKRSSNAAPRRNPGARPRSG